ncbi:hypothetical protein RND61_02750 [Streptomyces sp. TRM76323]|uniref:Chaplin domain-containing protein n=1 Tax=Streptomyces tamarix TaxID=3078565 RepID=A0ABU3QDZ2_9ACTN|nr:hypothetical protein [Streptomyces tamarix]MDT9681008.1 hypothetical protein [Streptomyces tamarix]
MMKRILAGSALVVSSTILAMGTASAAPAAPSAPASAAATQVVPDFCNYLKGIPVVGNVLCPQV